MEEKVYTRDPKKNSLVLAGYIKDDTFYREVKSKHFMVKMNGYGIQLDVFSKLQKRQIKNIILISRRSVFKSTLADWNTKSIKKDYGHGLQVFLSVNYMIKEKI